MLGGVGCYSDVVDSLSAGEGVASASSRSMGYHAGSGAELKVGGHAGVHADDRYTELHLGHDGTNGGTGSLVERLKPSYAGSMWTAGVTFYF